MNTTWKYWQSSSSAQRFASHAARAEPWHLGQWRAMLSGRGGELIRVIDGPVGGELVRSLRYFAGLLEQVHPERMPGG